MQINNLFLGIISSFKQGKQTQASDSHNDTRLQKITSKLLNGQHLKKTEQDFLNKLSKEKVSVKGFLRNVFSSKNKIERISRTILKRKQNFETITDKVAHIGLVDSHRSLVEQRALAKLLLNYQNALNQSVFIEEYSKATKGGKSLSSQEILKLIEKHNYLSASSPRMAGSLLLDEGGHKVYFNSKGQLYLASPERKVVEPIQLTPSNQDLEKADIEKIKEVHKEITEKRPYNNLGAMLEFMKFYREAKANNPDLTLKEAFQALQLDPAAIFDKYSSGDCVVISAKLQKEIKGIGFDSAVSGQYTEPIWAQPPIPYPAAGRLKNWSQYDQVTDNVHHCLNVIRFSEKGVEKGLFLHSFGLFENLVQDDWDKAKLQFSGKNDTDGNIKNVESILKMQLSGKTKMVITDSSEAKIFGVDLLRGNLYLNSEAAKQFNHLPLLKNGRFSINLESLKELDHQGVYYVDGREVTITHREALHLFYLQARELFNLPDDFEDNILALAENSDALFDEILLSPAKTARETIKETLAADKISDEARTNAVRYRFLFPGMQPPKGIKEAISQYQGLNDEIQELFIELQKAILENKPESVKDFAKQIEALNAKKKELESLIEGKSHLQ